MSSQRNKKKKSGKVGEVKPVKAWSGVRRGRIAITTIAPTKNDAEWYCGVRPNVAIRVGICDLRTHRIVPISPKGAKK